MFRRTRSPEGFTPTPTLLLLRAFSLSIKRYLGYKALVLPMAEESAAQQKTTPKSASGYTPTPTFASLRVVFRDTKRYLRAKIFTLGIFRKSAPQQKTTRTLVCGFTLIELLVVIAIIALLASIILASLNTARSKSRDARRVADVREVQTALELYNNDNGGYPSTLAPLVTSSYMPVFPTDPQTGVGYFYAAFGGSANHCSTYHIGAGLETTNTGVGSPLNSDADETSNALSLCTVSAAEFTGADAADCGGASDGHYCYDLKP